MKQELSEYLVDFIKNKSASKQEVATLVSQIVQAVKVARETMASDLKMTSKECMDMCKSLETASSSMEKSLATLIKESEKKTQDKAYRDLTNAVSNLEQQINNIERYDDSIIEKKWTVTIEEIRKQIGAWKQFELKGEEIVDKINALPIREEDQIDKEHIKGLVDLEKKVNSIEIRPSRGGGMRGLGIFIDGVDKGIVQYINLIAGTNMTLTYTQSNGRNDILFDASGGGSFTKLIATGTVDGSNTSFTFTSAPVQIIVDGGRSMQKVSSDGTVNWTGTTSVTLTVAPNSDIYAF